MTTVAAIAAEAFTAVAAELTDVIKTFTLTRTTQGAYNTSTGAYAVTTATDTGRAVFDFAATQSTFSDLFPAYVVGPSDKMLYLEGLTTLVPKENDTLAVAGLTLTIMAAVNLMESGGMYAVVAR